VTFLKQQILLAIVALQYFTRLPTPRLADFRTEWLARSLRFVPFVGSVVGYICIGAYWLSAQYYSRNLATGLMLAVSLLTTGAFHEDGFADACDGLGGGGTRTQVLAIMKDSRLGTFGVVGLVMLLALKWSVWVELPGPMFPLCVLTSQMVSRWTALILMWRLPYLRNDEESKARPLTSAIDVQEWLLSGGIGVLTILPLIAWGEQLPLVTLAATVLPGIAASALMSLLSVLYLRHRLGGYTGDCVGAVQQLSELSFLLAALLPIRMS
jgi:adenosylcobinamide-GDP ribazoletransferase